MSEFLLENDPVEMAMAVPLDRKIEQGIAFFRHWAKQRGKIVVCNSGGKDSAVVMKLAELAGIEFSSIYSVTTLDPPELVTHIRKVYPDTVWIRQPKPLLKRLVDKNGLPTRRARWCCLEYKETSENIATKVIGVRAEESPRRKGLWRQVVVDNKNKDKIILCPILYWTEKDVWEFIRLYNIPYCCLYDEGFSRLGCIGCPLAGAEHQKMEFERWPKFEKLWHKAAIGFFAKWVDVPLLRPRFIPESELGHYWPAEDLIYDIRIKDGKPIEGFWTKRRYLSAYKSGEDYWRWWLNRKEPEEDECQGVFMFANNDTPTAEEKGGRGW